MGLIVAVVLIILLFGGGGYGGYRAGWYGSPYGVGAGGIVSVLVIVLLLHLLGVW